MQNSVVLYTSLLAVFFMFRIIKNFRSIPSIEKQRTKARQIFNSRVFTDKGELVQLLKNYFSDVRWQYWSLLLNGIIFLTLFFYSRYHIWQVLNLPSSNFFLSTLAAISLVGYGTLMLITMFRSTRELIEDEYAFLNDYDF